MMSTFLSIFFWTCKTTLGRGYGGKGSHCPMLLSEIVGSQLVGKNSVVMLLRALKALKIYNSIKQYTCTLTNTDWQKIQQIGSIQYGKWIKHGLKRPLSLRSYWIEFHVIAPLKKCGSFHSLFWFDENQYVFLTSFLRRSRAEKHKK